MQHHTNPGHGASSTSDLRGWLLGGALFAAVGCNGNVVVGSGGGTGGAGGGTVTGAGGTTTTPTPTTSSTTTPTGPGCQSHDDCPGGLCMFATGTCGVACEVYPPCPTGQICGDCATSSCPGCADCVAACVPAPPGKCDDHDDCAAGQVCLFLTTKECAPACDDKQGCADPNLVCQTCATAACPICQACLGACLPSF